ncbi:MAG: hypothetical protein Q8S73_14735 [Deltaproteobacteria bacterium]|nr:hypothetical protein [Myxococcales bacterium]MDP3215361.1 hypothetical protein [Deltaproteobacteria bacterium]
MGDASRVDRWSFWIDDAVRAMQLAGLTVTHEPAGPAQRQAVIEAGRDGWTVRCTLRDELTAGPSVEVRCRAEGVPVELTLRPELVGEGFDKLLGMTVDQLVGDPDFDRVFVVASAPRSVAASLLSGPVREQLSALPRSTEGPTLSLKNGEIVLRWRAEPDAEHIGVGVAVISSMHALHRQMVEGDGAFGLGPFRQGAAGDRAIDPSARATAWQGFLHARRRTATVLTAAAIAGVGFLAAVITHHP